MTNLQSLTLKNIASCTFFNHELFDALTHLKKLTSLTIKGDENTLKGLKSFVNNAGGKLIAKMTQLKELCLDDFGNLNNEFVASICNLPLEKLSLKNTSIDSAATNDLMKLTHLNLLILPKSFVLLEDSPLLSLSNLSLNICE